ncbi:MAG: hypothetical protein ACJA1B_002638, partial [Polaribacter sp.]
MEESFSSILLYIKYDMNKFLVFFIQQLPVIVLFFTISSLSQTVIVSGEVVDNLGNYLPGVSILVEGTTNGVSTDFNGAYVLNIKTQNATIIFSYLGFETKKIKVENQKKINVILKESSDQLDEIQVVAFSKQKKNSVIGAITTLKVSELKQPTSNITNTLAGQISGL